jgi:tyrosine-protein phosphatase YwqE
MLSFFRKKKPVTVLTDLSSLGTDIHSHLVPAVDDGSDSVEMSLALIEGLVALGYRKIITTPHIRPEYFPNTRETILSGFEKLKMAVIEAGIEVELGVAAEYFIDYNFGATVEAGSLLTLSGNYVLVELSTFSPPPDLYDSIFKLRVKGYEPVLAHPERYVYFDKIQDFQKLKDFGCLLQVNLLSLTGHYGKPVRELALRFFKEDIVDLLGTDMHHPRHLESLRQLTTNSHVMSLIASRTFRNASL